MTLGQCLHLPHITTFNGPRCIFELRTNYNSYLPAPRILFDEKYLSVAFGCNTSFVLKVCHISRPFHPSRLGRRTEIWRKFGIQESFRFDTRRMKFVCSAFETGLHTSQFVITPLSRDWRISQMRQKMRIVQGIE